MQTDVTVNQRSVHKAAFPLLVTHVLPVGVRGIVVAGLLAALMSALAGVFNASSSSLHDGFLFKAQTKGITSQLVRVGRVATVVMVIIRTALDTCDTGSKRIV